MIYCDVFVPYFLDKALTYVCENLVQKGDVVCVQWRGKFVLGLVQNTFSTRPPHLPKRATLKAVRAIGNLSLGTHCIDFIEHVTRHTLIPRGYVWRMMAGSVPAGKLIHKDMLSDDSKSGPLQLQNHAPLEPSQSGALIHSQLKTLNGDQERAFQTIATFLSAIPPQFHTFLLDGVTGSGKTEVYFHVIYKALQKNKQILVMLPEIGLVDGWKIRFEAQFGFSPYVWHSHTTPKKRLDVWRTLTLGKPCVVVGTRSALFLPFMNLGCIIVDEEHDASYKQEEQGCYHGRDMAIVKGHLLKIPVILASATPSLETWTHTSSGKYTGLTLPSRFGDATLPDVHIIDRRIYKKISKAHPSWLSAPLYRALQQRLEAGEQSLLFMNRRGYAPITLCCSCGETLKCPACSITLTQHRSKNDTQLLCHHCNYRKPVPKQCPSCQYPHIMHHGVAIEQIEDNVRTLFPRARIITLTSDTTPVQQRDMWQDIQNQNVDIIIGTQLMAKGHDVPNLTLVGVVDADMGLYGSDWRATETTFQLLQQVGGRAGRRTRKGDVFIQTFQPHHPLFKAIAAYDRNGFLHEESTLRQQLHMPPFYRLVGLTFSGPHQDKVLMCAEQYASILHTAAPPHVRVLGPAPALYFKLKNKYRYNVFLSSPRQFALPAWLSTHTKGQVMPSSIQLNIDVDPIHFS